MKIKKYRMCLIGLLVFIFLSGCVVSESYKTGGRFSWHIFVLVAFFMVIRKGKGGFLAVFLEEEHEEQVAQYLEGAPDAVFRCSEFSVGVA